MKIAVTYEDGQVFQHFGHTEQFQVYRAEDGAVQSRELIGAEGGGHGALTELLSRLGVDTLICGGIGGGAQAALAQAGIRLCAGVSGSADEAVRAFLAGTLSYTAGSSCQGEHKEGGHPCGEDKHGCAGRG